MDNQLTEPPRLVSLSEVCQRLGISRRTAYRWMAEDRFPLPFVRVGTKVMFRPRQVAQFVEGE